MTWNPWHILRLRLSERELLFTTVHWAWVRIKDVEMKSSTSWSFFLFIGYSLNSTKPWQALQAFAPCNSLPYQQKKMSGFQKMYNREHLLFHTFCAVDSVQWMACPCINGVASAAVNLVTGKRCSCHSLAMSARTAEVIVGCWDLEVQVYRWDVAISTLWDSSPSVHVAR